MGWGFGFLVNLAINCGWVSDVFRDRPRERFDLMLRYFMISMLGLLPAAAELTATFTREGAEDTRLDRFPALSVPVGEPATPFLTPGAFEVVWRGKLVVESRQRLSFSFEGEGKATLKIAGKEVISREGELAGEASKATRINPGEHDFELSYRSKEDGSAAFRLYWEERGFPRQTVPFSAFKTEVTEAATLGELHRAGRLIFTEQNCAKCHQSATGFGAAPMPEVSEMGPILFGIGERTTAEWLNRWIADPKALKPTTHMPSLVDATTPEGRQQAADLTAYLLTMKLGVPQPAAPDAGLAQAGGAIFHELGCVACHQTPDGTGTADPNRVPLNNVASKYQPGALVAFLKKPDAFHGSIRMPDFQLTDEEAAKLAAFLTKASEGKETKLGHEFPEGDAKRGEELAKALDCGTCHAGLPLAESRSVPPLDAIFKTDWAAKGCAAPEEKRGKSPRLNLTDADRAALAAYVKTGAETLARDSSAEFARRQVEALRCTSCHTQDGDQALLNTVHADTQALVAHIAGHNERVDQTRPQLTYVGEMLYTSYIEGMLDGTLTPRPRPWLGIRMPAFRLHAKPMAAGLSRLHGVEPSTPEKVTVDAALAEIGKTLSGAEGFGCTTCHGVGDVKATAAFEVEGINFSLIPDRLRPDYYVRWMDHPASVTPSTKMPRYAEGNRSQRGDVLEGDALKQYEAIWQYIHSLKE